MLSNEERYKMLLEAQEIMFPDSEIPVGAYGHGSPSAYRVHWVNIWNTDTHYPFYFSGGNSIWEGPRNRGIQARLAIKYYKKIKLGG